MPTETFAPAVIRIVAGIDRQGGVAGLADWTILDAEAIRRGAHGVARSLINQSLTLPTYVFPGIVGNDLKHDEKSARALWECT